MTSRQSDTAWPYGQHISDPMGALLWRRVYAEKVDLSVELQLDADTLRSLLIQAGIPEPEDRQ